VAKKKVTDFLSVEDSTIARKPMLLTEAVLTTSVLGGVVTTQTAEGGCGCPASDCDCRCYTFLFYKHYLYCGYSHDVQE